jgi:hypothetical protein
MLWLVLLLLAVPAQTSEAQRPTLVVQVVDEVWIPVPGLNVEIRRPNAKEPLGAKRTDQRGYAGFSIEAGTCLIRVPAESGFAEASITARLVSPSDSQPTAYVQLRLTKYAKKPVLTHPRE